VTRLAIITGTSRGLGKALKDQFERVGWSVAQLNRPEFDLSSIDAERLAAKFKALHAADFRRVVFVNNAATQKIAPAASLQADEIVREITVNVTSPIIAIATFLRSFPAGEIANVTSVAATKAFPLWSLYCTAKAALEGYLRAIEAEGVRVFNLNPGAVDTDMQKAIRLSEFPGVEDFIALQRDGKLKSPDNVARSLVWMIDRAD
jgi:NAD(P)-dependent dehydrogenase (short-subunit alcohol dehydrogenase family)